MGHLMRSLALAEEAAGRGWEVGIAGDLDEVARARVRSWLPGVTVDQVSAGDVRGWLQARGAGVDVLHVDSYLPEVDALPDGRRLLSNMQDGAFGARPADLAIDANLGAEGRLAAVQARHVLAGITVVPIRRQVLAERERVQRREQAARSAEPARVLVVIGGTDPFGITTAVVAGLATLPGNFEVTVVTPPSQREAVERIAASSAQRIEPVAFLDDLPATASRHDLVISAAGTSVWEFACLGVPMALLWVADNQRAGYDAVVGAGVAVGLGRAPTRIWRSGSGRSARRCAMPARSPRCATGAGRSWTAWARGGSSRRGSSCSTYRRPRGTRPGWSRAPPRSTTPACCSTGATTR